METPEKLENNENSASLNESYTRKRVAQSPLNSFTITRFNRELSRSKNSLEREELRRPTKEFHAKES